MFNLRFGELNVQSKVVKLNNVAFIPKWCIQKKSKRRRMRKKEERCQAAKSYAHLSYLNFIYTANLIRLIAALKTRNSVTEPHAHTYKHAHTVQYMLESVVNFDLRRLRYVLLQLSSHSNVI